MSIQVRGSGYKHDILNTTHTLLHTLTPASKLGPNNLNHLSDLKKLELIKMIPNDRHLNPGRGHWPLLSSAGCPRAWISRWTERGLRASPGRHAGGRTPTLVRFARAMHSKDGRRVSCYYDLPATKIRLLAAFAESGRSPVSGRGISGATPADRCMPP